MWSTFPQPAETEAANFAAIPDSSTVLYSFVQNASLQPGFTKHLQVDRQVEA
jgi:hypothetical protein